MLVVGNGRLVARDAENPFIGGGAVAADGAVISKVGILEEIRKEFPEAELIDTKGSTIMPAFINTYEHIYGAMARGLSIKGYNSKGFPDILDGTRWTIDRHPANEQIRQNTRATYLDPIKNGVTAVFDHYASSGEIHDDLFVIEDAAKRMGIRACLCYEVSDRGGMGKAKAVVMENATQIEYVLIDQTDMSAGMMGMRAQFAISNETTKLAAANKPTKVGYHIHVVEGIEDLHDCLKRYGKRIVDRFMDCNILGSKTLPGHCIYVNPYEMELVRDVDAVAIHNSESSMRNACGYPPTMEIIRRGILIGFGTDGCTHDMTEPFKVVNALRKHHLYDANAAWGEAPQMLFEDSTGIADRYLKKPLRVLEEGAAADMIVTDYIPLTPMDASNTGGHILFGMIGRSVAAIVYGGKVPMKSRELVGMDEEKTLYEVREEAEKLERSING